MSSDRKEIQSLMARWRKKVGSPMPIDIAQQSLEKIRKAVRLVEAGAVVVVPKSLSLGDPKQPIDLNDDSLMNWDRNSEY
jgi:hypothetical protein